MASNPIALSDLLGPYSLDGMPSNRIWSGSRPWQGQSSSNALTYSTCNNRLTRFNCSFSLRHGKLVAVTSQEGVLRAKIQGPTESTLEKRAPAKL
jgi:hypothetical protein